MNTLSLENAMEVAKADDLKPVIKQSPKGGAYIYFEREGELPSYFIGQDDRPTKFMGAEDAANILRDAGLRRCTYEF